MTAAIATSLAILKTKYTQPKVYWEAYEDNPSFADIRHDETFDGNNKQIAVQTEAPIGRGFSIAQAQQNMGPGTYKDFLLTRIEDFGVARIKGQAMRAAAKSTGSLISLWTREMDGIILQVSRSAAINMWRTGTGSRGIISAGSTVGSATVTLATVADISNFYIGAQLQASATDGGAVRGGGAFATVTKINRVTGTMTVGTTWSGQIPGLAAGDYLYINGDAPNGGTNLMVTGVQAWVPPANAISAGVRINSNAFFGLDRTSDEVRLAGLYLDGTNTPMQEALIEAVAMAGVEGAKIDRVWMHPRDRAVLVKELGAKVQYVKETVKVEGIGDIGFKAIDLTLDEAEVRVMADINVPRFTSLVTQWDTWTFESIGQAPGILKEDGPDFLRTSNDDSYEVRVGYYGNLSNMAPARSVLISNFGL